MSEKYEIQKSMCEIINDNNFKEYEELIEVFREIENVGSLLGELIANDILYKDEKGIYRCK